MTDENQQTPINGAHSEQPTKTAAELFAFTQHRYAALRAKQIIESKQIDAVAIAKITVVQIQLHCLMNALKASGFDTDGVYAGAIKILEEETARMMGPQLVVPVGVGKRQ